MYIPLYVPLHSFTTQKLAKTARRGEENGRRDTRRELVLKSLGVYNRGNFFKR